MADISRKAARLQKARIITDQSRGRKKLPFSSIKRRNIYTIASIKHRNIYTIASFEVSEGEVLYEIDRKTWHAHCDRYF